MSYKQKSDTQSCYCWPFKCGQTNMRIKETNAWSQRSIFIIIFGGGHFPDSLPMAAPGSESVKEENEMKLAFSIRSL